jgi:hypothetical protein
MPAFCKSDAYEEITVTLRLPPPEAEALAELCKRFLHDDAARLSNRHDRGAECAAMMHGVMLFGRGLAQDGFAPREGRPTRKIPPPARKPAAGIGLSEVAAGALIQAAGRCKPQILMCTPK